MRFLGRWLYRFVAAFGVLSLVLVVGLSLVGWRLAARFAEPTAMLPERFVLVADWRGGVPEKSRGFGPLQDLGFGKGASLPETLIALERAADDPRVAGLVVRVDGGGFGFAQAYELREAVRGLAAAGRFTAVYADTLGELEGGMVGTYLATAFEHVQLQPLGTLGFTGLASEQPYFGRLLDDLEIGFQVIQREDFKTALEPLARSGPSPAAGAATDRLLDGLFTTLVDGVAEARGLDPTAVERALDRGPLLGREAVELGLVDAIGHLPDLWATAENEAGTEERVDLATYARSGLPGAEEATRVVGFVHAVGPIRRGESEDPLGDLEIAGDSVARAIDDAVEAEVDALLLRVSSPGGSAIASETIGAAVRRGREAGIPVIVSMGDVAASGGYWISMDADRIFASPTTLTGSIGVIAGKPALGAFLDDFGVDVALERRGTNAGFGSVVEPWDGPALARLNLLIDDLYERFLEGVARGRDIDIEAARAVAGGQVWLGDEALANGLVDEIGGFTAALAAARTRAGATADEPVRLARFPEAREPFALALEGLDRLLEVAVGLEATWDRATAPPALRLEAGPLPQPR